MLQLKTENVFGVEGGGVDEVVEAAVPLSDPKMKKKRRLKIKAGGTGNGTRTVFDEQGEMRNPLELLAHEQARSGQDEADFSTPAERMAAAAMAVKGRDVEDKRRMKDLRREKKLERRRKEREFEASRGGAGGGTALLGNPAGSDDSGPPGRDGSESDSGEEPAPKLRIDPAHVGMAVRKKEQRVEDMDLEAQEALALRVLGGRT